MRGAVYNSAIPETSQKSVNNAFCPAFVVRVLRFALLLGAFGPAVARAADWSAVEQQLARKIVAVTGPGAVALTVENHSSLGRRDGDIVQNGLRSALEQAGIHLVKAEQSAASVAITLSENPTSYVWVAEIHQGAGAASVVMVSVARSGRSSVVHDSMPIALRKTLLWTQDGPMLDLAVLEENGTPARIAVLTPENVSLYRLQSGKWQAEQTLEVSHTRPWPLDLRGRLVPARDHLLDAYLPGVICRTGAGGVVTMSCHDGDDPWPLVPAGGSVNASVFPSAGSTSKTSAAIPPLAAFFAPTRNFFTGVLTPAIGKFSTVPKFYSAAFLPREKYTLWLFAATDGKVHLVDGVSDQPSKFEWGSDIAAVRTSCGAGWQVLAADAGERSSDSVRAYEFPDREPVAVSAAADFPGAISALWSEARGDTAIGIVKNRESGSYEAYRLELVCSQ